MNRIKLLQLLKKQHGYDGPPELEAVKAWLASYDIQLQDDEGDPVAVEKVWKKTVTIAVTADADEDVVVTDGTMEDEDEPMEPEGAQFGDDDDDDDDEKSLRRENRRLRDQVSRNNGKNRKVAKANAMMTPRSFRRQAEYKRYERKIRKGEATFASPDMAEAFGSWVRCSSMPGRNYGTQEDREVLKSLSIETRQKASFGTQNALGGAFVPDEFINELIDLFENFGVARQVLNVVPMNRDTGFFPRVTSGLTVYSPGENQAITESNVGTDNVELVTRELAILTRHPMSLLEDSAVNLGDLVGRKMALAFATTEDDMAFNGDGTSTYFGVTGMRTALSSLSGTIANISGLYVGTANGNDYGDLLIDDFEGVIGRLPEFPGTNPKWIVHKRFWAEVMFRLAVASGGTTKTEVESGAQVKSFLGDEVIISQKMPRTAALSQVAALYGDYAMGGMFGDRKSMEVATSDQRYFDNNQFAIRAIERVAINIHDVGNASATEADREAGPIVGLITAAS